MYLSKKLLLKFLMNMSGLPYLYDEGSALRVKKGFQIISWVVPEYSIIPFSLRRSFFYKLSRIFS